MLEITGKEITELSDGDLRSLVGLLCEADLRSTGIPTAGVTWGGHQNAKDGGIDVQVELTTTIHRDGFIPRSKTLFQVKKPDMPRASIISEMRPKGELRQVIKDLGDAGGAYIIVSSQGSTAASALEDRKAAMREALFDCPHASNIKVDFYDRERIAGWVRSHPSLVLWVRDKIGQAIQGWRAFGNWSNSPGGVEEVYMLDGHVRLYNCANPRSDAHSVLDGINELRSILQRPASSIRLVGLSGVGKTRLLQALFDERIGERPLNQSQVFYSDVSDSPIPDPRNFAERLMALQTPAILAIDNCPPDLHKRLTSLCSASGSLVSLITIEYDVREDQPEETDVFRLEPASIELIEKIIRSRFNHINEVSARSIAEFSGGNARIAIALSHTIRRGENLAELKDNELFNRLFLQRNEPSSPLLRAAEACSLVYSFNCQTVEGSDDELKLLGSLVDMSVREIYENVSELKRRDLVQQRSKWRAVLPQALANRLAQRALEDVPLDSICNVFEKSERLLKSFSRRLGYLHESEKAIEISQKWLAENGLLGDVSNLNELGINLLKNIAPINPESTLSAIERVSKRDDASKYFSRENTHHTELTRLLRSLAYDKELFERSVQLLCRFALSESPKENYNSIRDLLKSLFYAYLSGTHATPEQRISIISNLATSTIGDQIDLSISLLDASLESYHFSSSHSFEFGARSRDYGLSPRSPEEISQWYKVYIEYTVVLAVSDLLVAPKARSLLAEKFRGLWTEVEMYDELNHAAKEISRKCSWAEGWVAVRTTKRFEGKDMNPEVLSRLNNLEAILEPTTLIQRAKLYAISDDRNTLDLVDTVENLDEEGMDDYLIVENITRSLGREVGNNNEVFKELLPDILSNNGARLFSFGQGLAEGCLNPMKMWQDFCSQLSLLEESNRNYQVLRGFLNTISELNTDLVEDLLNMAITDEVLAYVFPLLQTSVEINVQGVERLKQALEFGAAPIWQYGNLAYSGIHKTIKDGDYCELISLISSKTEGTAVAVDILHMRIHRHSKGTPLSDTIVSLGQELLLKYQFLRNDARVSSRAYKLAKVIKACFANESAKENARILCKKLVEALKNYDISFMDYGYVLEALTIVKPVAFLDVFVGEDIKPEHQIKQFLSRGARSSSIWHIDEELLIDWCETNPTTRYPTLASAILPYRKNENLLEWTPLALKIIANSPAPIVVLDELKANFRPWSWSGSLAEIMQNCLKLILDLKEHEDPMVVDWAYREEKIFEQEIRSERQSELLRESERNERFE